MSVNIEKPAFRGSIFISYRRADAPGFVRALMSELRNRFGSQQVFLDMEDIEAGSHFPDVIDQAVSGCEVTLVVIGPQWLQMTNAAGLRRLDDPEDFVRLEVCSSLARGIPVIPVLVDKARMPADEELPDRLQRLPTLHAVALTYDHWDEDIERLIEAIERVTMEPRFARLYAQALERLDGGHWQLALQDLESIYAVQPRYRDVGERLTVLRELATRAAHFDRPRRWRKAVLLFPVATLILLCLLPNLLAAQFNYNFNWQVIVTDMARRGIADAEACFQLSVRLVNVVAFPLGIGLWTWLAWPVRRALLNKGRPTATVAPKPMKDIRLRCLSLGWLAAVICSAIWIAAGPIYPLSIGSMATQDYVYFTLSLGICGVMAATYPFLFVTWLCLHLLYPRLLVPGDVHAEELDLMQRLGVWALRALMAAGTVPLLIVTLGLALNTQIGSASTVVALLGGVGLIGFALALRLFGAIQRDLAYLHQLTRAYGGRFLKSEARSPSAVTGPAQAVRSA